jgi:hypothetical protein
MPADEEMFDSTDEIVRAYQAGGFKGYLPDERAKDEFLATNPVKAFSSPKSGKGKRALLYGYVLRFDPHAYSERQTVGDCVSHGSRSARDCNRAVSILINGQPNDWLVRTATEPTYGARGHGREGMSPALASRSWIPRSSGWRWICALRKRKVKKPSWNSLRVVASTGEVIACMKPAALSARRGSGFMSMARLKKMIKASKHARS